MQLAGRFNAANALAALTAACATGAPLDDAVRGLEGLERVRVAWSGSTSASRTRW